MKLVGFDDTAVSSLTTPTITTIHQPVEEMVRAAVSALLDAGQGKLVPSRTILPVRLIERESTENEI